MEEFETILIDLAQVQSSHQLLDLIGERLELGGLNGNVSVTGSIAGSGWGKNWDALKDSLTYLDTGGIWGTSRIFRFPLCLQFINSEMYRNSDAIGYTNLSEILELVASIYAKDGMRFKYAFQ